MLKLEIVVLLIQLQPALDPSQQRPFHHVPLRLQIFHKLTQVGTGFFLNQRFLQLPPEASDAVPDCYDFQEDDGHAPPVNADGCHFRWIWSVVNLAQEFGKFFFSPASHADGWSINLYDKFATLHHINVVDAQPTIKSILITLFLDVVLQSRSQFLHQPPKLVSQIFVTDQSSEPEVLFQLDALQRTFIGIGEGHALCGEFECRGKLDAAFKYWVIVPQISHLLAFLQVADSVSCERRLHSSPCTSETLLFGLGDAADELELKRGAFVGFMIWIYGETIYDRVGCYFWSIWLLSASKWYYCKPESVKYHNFISKASFCGEQAHSFKQFFDRLGSMDCEEFEDGGSSVFVSGNADFVLEGEEEGGQLEGGKVFKFVGQNDLASRLSFHTKHINDSQFIISMPFLLLPVHHPSLNKLSIG